MTCRKKCGLTLIETLGVAILVGLLVTISSITYLKSRERALHKVLDQRFAIVGNALNLYKIDRGAWPTNLRDLKSASYTSNSYYLNEVPRDPFTDDSDDFQWVRISSDSGLLRSAGPDGKRQTSDDICFRVELMTKGPC